MELNVNSLHARIFRWVLFVSKGDMPKTLCPYFWQSVLMWLFMIPLLVVTLPVRIVRIFNDGWRWKNMGFGEVIAISLISYFGIFVTYCMGFFIYCLFANVGEEYFKKNETFLFIGFISWFVLIVVGLVYSYTIIKEYRERKKMEKYDFDKPEKKNVIIESIKGIYNKYCPRIEWKE